MSRKTSIPTALLLALALAGSVCQASEKESDTITIGVRDDIINFGYYNETTEKYYGLEIDIAEELADRLGYKNVEFVSVEAQDRKRMLLMGEVDCLIAAYSISETRKQSFNFSVPYYTDRTVIMVEKSTLFDEVKDLSGKTIGVLNGADAGALLGNVLFDEGVVSGSILSNNDKFTKYDNALVLKAPTYEELSNMLESGEVDAACLDACIASTYMNEDRTFLDYTISEQKFGVATRKSSELSEPVNDAIQEMLDDGTIDTYIEKWS